MLSGLGMVSDDDILDTLRNIAYPTILQKYLTSDYEFLMETDSMFYMMPLDSKDAGTHNSFRADKSSKTNELQSNRSPVTFEQALDLVKSHWTSLERDISNDLYKFLSDNLLELTFPVSTRPAHYVIDPYCRYNLDSRIKGNKIIAHKMRMAAKGIRASITKQGYSTKTVMSVFAGKYINWLGREDSQYLYAKLGKHASAETYNLLQRDRIPYQYYMENALTKNWTIAISIALAPGWVGKSRVSRNGEFTSIYDDHKTSTRDLIIYAKSQWLSLCPYYEDKVFQNISPRLIKDTYHNYPKQLHRLVALIAELGIDSPTYTMSKKLIHKEQFLHAKTIELASAISNAAKLDYKTTQNHAVDQFIHEIRNQPAFFDEYAGNPEWPQYVPFPPHDDHDVREVNNFFDPVFALAA